MSRLYQKSTLSEGLVEHFSKMDFIKGKSIIIPRSEASKEFVLKALSDLGMSVDELFLYNVLTSNIDSSWKDFTSLLEQKRWMLLFSQVRLRLSLSLKSCRD